MGVVAGLQFLTPTAALVALGALLPLAVLALADRRSTRLRTILGLPAAGLAGRLVVPVAVCAACGLVAVAAAQPVVRTEHPRLTRRDAQAFVAIDISRSMLASPSFRAASRIERAKGIADRLRAGLADVPIGVVTFTDRTLPLLFPTTSAGAFTATVAKAVGIEHPPPRSQAQVVTTFDALAPLPGSGYFNPAIPHRVLFVVTDAESESFDVDGARYSFSAKPRIAVVVVRVGSTRERVFGPDGVPEPAYAPPPASDRLLAQFLAATHGKAFGERDVAGAVQAARSALGTGPRERLGTVSGRKDLAPYFVLAAILPLGVVLRWRNL
jgi:hypothetical protein